MDIKNKVNEYIKNHDKVIQKDKKLIETAKKKNKTIEDVLYLMFHDPIVRVVLCLPLVIIAIDIVFAFFDLFSLLLWIIMYIAIFLLIKYLPVKEKEEKEEIDYEAMAPKRADYPNIIGYIWANLKFAYDGIRGRLDHGDKK